MLSLCQDSTGTNAKRNTVYIDILGPGGYYSLSFDRLFRVNKKNKNSISIGFEIAGITKPYFSTYIPTSYNILFGKKNRHLELGIGLTFGLERMYHQSFYSAPQLPVGHLLEEVDHSINFDLWALPRIGYRYQKENGGFFFRISLTPIIVLLEYEGPVKYKNESQFNIPSTITYLRPIGKSPVFFWGGISLGRTF